MRTFVIWWKDLTEEAQQEFLDFFGFEAEEFSAFTPIASVDIDTAELTRL